MSLSVVIPVYKAEQTLDRCLNSVLSQDIDDMEVIVVDDGSPDNCPEMCDRWAQQDSRVHVIHKQNGGLSDARNVGIEAAKGDYITFVDSDDYLAEGIYNKMLGIIGKNPDIDIMEFSIKCIGIDKIDINYQDRTFLSAREYWQETRAWNHAYACNKIIRRVFLGNTRFPVGRLYEDLLVLPDLLLQNPVVATSSAIGYNYCANTNGISMCPDCENIKQLLSAEQNAAKMMHSKWYSPKDFNLYMCMLYRQIDIYRLSGEIILKWPFVRLICWVHKMTKGRNRSAHTA